MGQRQFVIDERGGHERRADAGVQRLDLPVPAGTVSAETYVRRDPGKAHRPAGLTLGGGDDFLQVIEKLRIEPPFHVIL